MAAYLEKAKAALEHFKFYTIEQVPREKNLNADALARLAMSTEVDELNIVPNEHLSTPSITEPEQEDVCMINSEPTWMTPIIRYLETGILPKERTKAKKLMYQIPRYTVVEGRLYRRGYSMPLLRCVIPPEAKKIMEEIHEGFCGDHTGGHSLSKKIIRQGYFWPTIKANSFDYIKKCDKCQ